MELEVDFDSTDHDRNVGDIVAVEVENQALWRAKVLEVGKEKVTLRYIVRAAQDMTVPDI